MKLPDILFKLLLSIPFFYWIYLIASDSLGADPAKTLNHSMGDISLYFLFFNLALGAWSAFSLPRPNFSKAFFANRRFLGIVTFFYLVLHVSMYLVLEGFEAKAFLQIVTKLYLILGFCAWFILALLAITSNNYSVRKLGFRRWKLLHQCVHFAMALLTIHVLLIEKADLVKFGALLGTYWLLQSIRGGRALLLRFRAR